MQACHWPTVSSYLAEREGLGDRDPVRRLLAPVPGIRAHHEAAGRDLDHLRAVLAVLDACRRSVPTGRAASSTFGAGFGLRLRPDQLAEDEAALTVLGLDLIPVAAVGQADHAQRGAGRRPWPRARYSALGPWRMLRGPDRLVVAPDRRESPGSAAPARRWRRRQVALGDGGSIAACWPSAGAAAVVVGPGVGTLRVAAGGSIAASSVGAGAVAAWLAASAGSRLAAGGSTAACGGATGAAGVWLGGGALAPAPTGAADCGLRRRRRAGRRRPAAAARRAAGSAAAARASPARSRSRPRPGRLICSVEETLAP